MIQLPRLTQLVQLVDPKTGLPTLRGSDFWNQMVTAIEANLSSIQTASGTIDSNSTIISQILAGDTDVALLDHANTWLDAQAFDQALEAPGYNIDGVPVGGITADVGGTISTFRTLSAGTDLSLSGTGDDLIINFDGTPGLSFENSGTSVGVAGTINAPSGDGSWSVAAGVASYVPPGGGGGAVALVSAQTLSTVTEVDFVLTSGFDYFVVVQNLTVTGGDIGVQFGTGAGPTWDVAADYNWSIKNDFAISENAASANFISFFGGPATVSGYSFKFDILGGCEVAANHSVSGMTTGSNTNYRINGTHDQTVAITGARIAVTAGTVSGNFYLYSVQR